VAFLESSVVVVGDFTIATGTLALPTGVLSVGGSFINNGYFMHNNGEIDFTGSGSEVVTLSGENFFNTLYDVTFSGSGDWTFTDENATTSNDFLVTDGTVTVGNGTLAIGGRLSVTGGGDFEPNNGTVIFYSTSPETITTGSGELNDVIFGQMPVDDGWYDPEWEARTEIRIQPSAVEADVTDFPVFIDMSQLGNDFWSAVESDGADLRMTTGNGRTEVPLEVVMIDVAAKTGELHFLAPSLSQLTETTFYLYHDNPDAEPVAVDSTYGGEQVWVNYEVVYHFADVETQGLRDSTKFDRDLAVTEGVYATTSGLVGTALTMNGTLELGDNDWTWTAGLRPDLLRTLLHE
jgi:hypothetical protein